MDINTTAFVIIVVLTVLYFLTGSLKKPKKSVMLHYEQRGELLSPAERSFYGVLEQAINEDVKIFAKVRIADVLTPTASLNKSHWQTAFNKISAKHFDYVLCCKATMKVMAVVELDDKSHHSKAAKRRDLLVDEACASANLRLVRFTAKETYQIDLVKTDLGTLIL